MAHPGPGRDTIRLPCCGLRRCQELGLREFVWVVASLSWRRGGRHRQAARRKSVHRSAKLASRCRFGALVYTVAPLWTGGATQECTQIGENGLSAPFWGTCVHCCDASFATRVASGGTSIPTTMACRRRPLAGPSRLVGKTGSARVAPPLGWHLRQGSNPHKSSMSLGTQGYTKDERAVHRAKAPSPWICSPDGPVTLLPFKVGRDRPDSGVESR